MFLSKSETTPTLNQVMGHDVNHIKNDQYANETSNYKTLQNNNLMVESSIKTLPLSQVSCVGHKSNLALNPSPSM